MTRAQLTVSCAALVLHRFRAGSGWLRSASVAFLVTLGALVAVAPATMYAQAQNANGVVASNQRAPLAAAQGRGVRMESTFAGTAATASGTATAATPEPAPTATDLELALFKLTNADRLANDLEPVTLDLDLLPVARARAAAQLQLKALSHVDAAGKLAFSKLLADAGVTYELAGENLARLSGSVATAAERAEKALMESPTHRANILGVTYDRVAIGVATDTEGRTVFAQVFCATGRAYVVKGLAR